MHATALVRTHRARTQVHIKCAPHARELALACAHTRKRTSEECVARRGAALVLRDELAADTAGTYLQGMAPVRRGMCTPLHDILDEMGRERAAFVAKQQPMPAPASEAICRRQIA